MLFRFFFYHCPAVLEDEELFDKLLHFVHRLLQKTARVERERMMARIMKVSPC